MAEGIREAEPLEPRRLLAGIEAGVLVARGTAGSDTISLRRHLTDDVIVTTNGASQTFDMDDFTGVLLEGLGGNDTFRMIDPLVSPLVRDTTIVGGAGNDTVDYSTRSAGITFWIDPTGPADSTPPGAVSGAQHDEFAEVETIIGGSGNDTFQYAQRNEDEGQTTSFRLEGRGGNDAFRDLMFGDVDAFGAVTMLGGEGNDGFGNESDDDFTNEFFFGEAGNDSVTVFKTNTGVIDGGSGIDTINFSGSLEEDNAEESAGVDDFPNFENATKSFGSLFGNDGPNQLSMFGPGTVFGGGGNDTIVGGGDEQLLDGGAGNDRISGHEGNDTLDGGAGIDTMDGGVGNDTLLNGELVPLTPRIRIADRILFADDTWGGADISIMRVGIDDVIVRIDNFSRQVDMDDFDGVLLRGNNGYDRIEVLDALVSPVARRVTLEGGGGNDTLVGSNFRDVLRGGDGDDSLLGLGDADALFGGPGNDFVEGNSGSDFHDGGDGNDDLRADDGAAGDTVLGGSGNDSAVVDAGDVISAVETVTEPV